MMMTQQWGSKTWGNFEPYSQNSGLPFSLSLCDSGQDQGTANRVSFGTVTDTLSLSKTLLFISTRTAATSLHVVHDDVIVGGLNSTQDVNRVLSFTLLRMLTVFSFARVCLCFVFHLSRVFLCIYKNVVLIAYGKRAVADAMTNWISSLSVLTTYSYGLFMQHGERKQ